MILHCVHIGKTSKHMGRHGNDDIETIRFKNLMLMYIPLSCLPTIIQHNVPTVPSPHFPLYLLPSVLTYNNLRSRPGKISNKL